MRDRLRYILDPQKIRKMALFEVETCNAQVAERGIRLQKKHVKNNTFGHFLHKKVNKLSLRS